MKMAMCLLCTQMATPSNSSRAVETNEESVKVCIRLIRRRVAHTYCVASVETGRRVLEWGRITDLYRCALVRVWRFLVDMKACGQPYDIARYVPEMRDGSLVIPCTACPRAMINMPPKWEDDPKRYVLVIHIVYLLTRNSCSYIHRKVISLDGNHHLQKYNGSRQNRMTTSLVGDRSLFPSEHDCEMIERYNDPIDVSELYMRVLFCPDVLCLDSHMRKSCHSAVTERCQIQVLRDFWSNSSNLPTQSPPQHD